MTQVTEPTITKATFRVIYETPGHITFGIWINGGKSGELIVASREQFDFIKMLVSAGFEYRSLS